MIIPEIFLNREIKVESIKHNCLYKDDINFILIPKCATQSIKATLICKGFEKGKVKEIRCKKNVALIRDPLRKWFCGFATYIQLQVTHKNIKENESFQILDNFKIMRYITDVLEFDIHTKAQWKQVKDMDIKLFNLDEIDKLLIWFNENGVKLERINYIHATHMMTKNKFYMEFYNRLVKIVMNNNEYVQKIKNHFKKDYELLKECV